MVGLGLLDDVEVLGLAGAHSHLRHIDVAVALGNHTEVFLADLLTAGGELGDSAGRDSLRALSAGVGGAVNCIMLRNIENTSRR